MKKIKENILGYDVNNYSADVFSDKLFQSLQDGKRAWLACFNPHSYVVTLKDKVFARALKDADWLVPDGAGVVLASCLLGGSIDKRVTGSDVFAGLHKRMNAEGGMSVFFLGSTKETLELIRQRITSDYPNIKVAGMYSPPFKEVYSPTELDAMINAINFAAPDVMWVGITAPKQEKWIYQNKDKLNVKFIGAVGAVFDFCAGNVKRSHLWFREHGLEWLPRLLQEPRRLWRRTFISAPVFFWLVFRQRLRQGADRRNGAKA